MKDASPCMARLLLPTFNSSEPIATPEGREALREENILPKNTTQWSRPALEPGLLDLVPRRVIHVATTPPSIFKHT